MTDLAMPSGLAPAKITFTLDINKPVAASPLNRVVQEQGRPGDSWRATVQWPPLLGDRALALAAWLDQVGKAGNCALLPVSQNDNAGTELADALFADLNGPWRLNQFVGWASTNLAVDPLLDGPYAVLLGGASAPAYISRSFSVTQGLPYNLVLDVPDRRGAFYRLLVADANGSLIDTGSAGSTSYGRLAFTVFPTSDTLVVRLYTANDTDGFQKGVYGDLKIHRALVTQGARTAGAGIVGVQGGTIGLPTRSVKRGQFITIKTSLGYELKRCQNSLYLYGGGNINGIAVTHAGGVDFEPATRGSIADRAGIFHLQPWCRMRLATAASSADVTPGGVHGITVDFVEQLR